MKNSIELFGLNITVDPLNKFNVPVHKIIDACGLVLEWVADAPKEVKLVPFLDKCYAHGGGWYPFNGYTIHKDGSLSYPEDPTLYPLIEVQHEKEVFRQYPYSWVSVTQEDGTTEVARMD